MYPEEKPSGILCGGKEPIKAISACVQPGCTTDGMLCGRQECECTKQHPGHHIIEINGLDNVISTQPIILEYYSKLEKRVCQTIAHWVAELQSIERSHNAHITKKAQVYHTHGVLKRKLLN